MGKSNPRNERDVKAIVKDICKEHGAYYAMPHQAGYGVAGVPDFLICYRGRFFGVETKFGSNKPTAHQVEQLRQIRMAGGIDLVINEKNTDELRRAFRVIDDL